MKFVIYKGQTKFTIDNVSVPEIAAVSYIEHDIRESTMTVDELDICKFRITSMGGLLDHQDMFPESFEQEQEWEEGIHCRQETVN